MLLFPFKLTLELVWKIPIVSHNGIPIASHHGVRMTSNNEDSCTQLDGNHMLQTWMEAPSNEMLRDQWICTSHEETHSETCMA